MKSSRPALQHETLPKTTKTLFSRQWASCPSFSSWQRWGKCHASLYEAFSQHGHLLSVCLTVSVHTSVSEKKKLTSRQLQISWDFMIVTKVWTELGSENTSILLFLCDTNKGLSSKLQFLPPSPFYCLLYQCCFPASIPESNEIALSRFSTYCLHPYEPLPWG